MKIENALIPDPSPIIKMVEGNFRGSLVKQHFGFPQMWNSGTGITGKYSLF